MSDVTKILFLLVPLVVLVVAFAVSEENAVGSAAGLYAIVGGVALGVLLARGEPDPDEVAAAYADGDPARVPPADPPVADPSGAPPTVPIAPDRP